MTKDVLLQMQPVAVTFDVFDTAITRCWARPEHLFLACGERLRSAGLIQMGAEAWMRLRIQSEHRAAVKRGSDLAGFDDIYSEARSATGWTLEETAIALDIEERTEIQSVRAVPETLRLWKALERPDCQRRFLSDMYLPERVVHALLQRAGYSADVSEVWVSSQRRASKRSGELFAAARDALQSPANQPVVHIGDNPDSDVKQARRAGFIPYPFLGAQLPKVALDLLACTGARLLLRSLVAGGIRLATLETTTEPSDPLASGRFRLGCVYGGPILTLYVWWLMLDAEQRGIERLYFLARDGQVLMEIAKVLKAGGVGAGIELKYLYASRQAWFAPSITHWDTQTLARILDEPDRLGDPAKLSRRLGFAGASAMLATWPQLDGVVSADLTNLEVAKRLARVVAADAGLVHTASLRRLTIDYLQQMGLFDGTPWAIVDLGWRGRMQEALARIVQSHHDSARVTTVGYYLGLLEQPTVRPPNSLTLTFHAGDRTDEQYRLLAPAHLLELLCEADHGSTNGYRRADANTIEPLVDLSGNAHVVEWGLADYRSGVLSFAFQLAQSLPMLGDSVPTRIELLRMSEFISRELTTSPEIGVADALARIPSSYSSNHEDAKEMACQLESLDAWVRALTLGRAKLSTTRSNWLPGSLARCSGPAQYSTYVALQRVARRARERFSQPT